MDPQSSATVLCRPALGPEVWVGRVLQHPPLVSSPQRSLSFALLRIVMRPWITRSTSSSLTKHQNHRNVANMNLTPQFHRTFITAPSNLQRGGVLSRAPVDMEQELPLLTRLWNSKESIAATFSAIFSEKSEVFFKAIDATKVCWGLWWELLGPVLVYILVALRDGIILLLRALAPIWPYLVRSYDAVRYQTFRVAVDSWPHIKRGAKHMAKEIAASDPRTIAGVILLFATLVASWIGLRKLTKMGTKSMSKGKDKFLWRSSRLLLSYLILFVILFLPNFIFEDDVLPTTVLVHIPLYMTFRFLSGSKNLSKDSMDHWLCYWSVYAFLDLIWRFPWIGAALQSSTWFGKFRLFLGIWLGLPTFGGADLVVDVLVPLVDKNFKRIPKKDFTQQSNAVIRLLTMTNFVTEETAKELTVALADPGSFVAVASICLITPVTITRGACLFVELVYPIYASMYSYFNESLLLKTKWLRYWFVCRMFLLILDQIRHVTDMIPLSVRAELLFVIWLQIPYFNGAGVIYRKLAAWSNRGARVAAAARSLSRGNSMVEDELPPREALVEDESTAEEGPQEQSLEEKKKN